MSPRLPASMLGLLLLAGGLGSCGGSASIASTSAAVNARAGQRPPPAGPLVVSPAQSAGSAWQPVARIGTRVAAWQAERSGVSLLRFDQGLVRLDLHAGQGEPSGTWKYGDRIEPSEIHRVVAAFNGGFKFSTGAVGWLADGRVAAPLQSGRASIVTYRDGTTAIGAWHQGVPAAGKQLFSVLQNLSLLVDHGAAAGSVSSCIQSCWGATLGGVDVIARSALGITSSGELVWGAGERLLPATLAAALVRAGVQRAVELDINPDWVAGYLYLHGGRGPTGSPVVPEQLGIAGRFLEPYSRDFFAIVAR